MSALAWPLVALVAIAAAVYLVRRWQDRAVDVEAAQKALEGSMADALVKARQAQLDAAGARFEAKGVEELRARVNSLELAAGLSR